MSAGLFSLEAARMFCRISAINSISLACAPPLAGPSLASAGQRAPCSTHWRKVALAWSESGPPWAKIGTMSRPKSIEPPGAAAAAGGALAEGKLTEAGQLAPCESQRRRMSLDLSESGPPCSKIGSMSRAKSAFMTILSVRPSGQLAPSAIHWRMRSDSCLARGALFWGMRLSSLSGRTVKE